jgi:uncharacterized membrane protein YoaK (UPF0700 family)
MRGAIRGALLPRAGDRHGPLVPLMIALTLLTGVVDAGSYLRLGHVFVANMTGNVVFVGFALAGAGGLSVASSLVALGAFVLGARAGGRIGAAHGTHRGRLLRTSSATQAVLVAVALAVALLSASPEPAGVRYAITGVLAVSMGVQNAAATRLAVPELTTTVLTKTLTGLASATRAEAGLTARRVAAVLAMALGGLAGALLALDVSVTADLALALALACTVGLAAHLASRGDPPWTRVE